MVELKSLMVLITQRNIFLSQEQTYVSLTDFGPLYPNLGSDLLQRVTILNYTLDYTSIYRAKYAILGFFNCLNGWLIFF